MSIEKHIAELTEAVKENTEALLSLNSNGGSSKAASPAKKTTTKKVEKEEEMEERFFYKKSNGETFRTTDAKEIARLVKARGVQEVDEDEFDAILEKHQAAIAEKQREAEEAEEEAEDDDLLDDDDEEDDEEDEVTLDDAKEVLRDLKDKKGADAVRGVFKKLGVENFKEVDKDDAGKAIKLAKAALKAKA